MNVTDLNNLDPHLSKALKANLRSNKYAAMDSLNALRGSLSNSKASRTADKTTLVFKETTLPDPANVYKNVGARLANLPKGEASRQLLDPDTIVFECPPKNGCIETGNLSQVHADVNEKILANDFTVCDPFDKRPTKSGYREVKAVAVGRTDGGVCNEIRKQNENEKWVKLFFPEAYLVGMFK